MNTIYEKRVILADLCRRARPGGDWEGFKPVAFECKRTDTQWFFLDLPWAYVVLFPGTNPRSVKDIVTDIRFRKKVIPYGNKASKIRVHRGFLEAYKSVRDQIHQVVLHQISDFKPVVVVGHSLGGALATLCVVDMQYNMRPQGDLYTHRRILHWMTFGAPRVGNAAFGRSFRVRCGRGFRFWGWWDMVVKLPFWILGFRHVIRGEGLRTRHDIRGYLRCLDPKRK